MNCDCLHDNRPDAVLGEWVRLDHSVRWMILVFCLTVSLNGENPCTSISGGSLAYPRTKPIPYPFLTQDIATDF
jgi:hypothetical protein